MRTCAIIHPLHLELETAHDMHENADQDVRKLRTTLRPFFQSARDIMCREREVELVLKKKSGAGSVQK